MNEGNDTILSGEAITLWGQQGNDYMTNTGVIGGDIPGHQLTGDFHGGDGDDTLVNTSTASTPYGASIDGGTGNDSIHNDASLEADIYGGDGDDTLVNTGHVQTRPSDAVPWPVYGYIHGGAGHDSIVSSGTVDQDITAAAGNDTIVNTGTVLDDIDGGLGDDRLLNAGSAGDLYGRDGDDTLINEGAAADLYGETGHDSLLNNGSAQFVYAGDGDDTVTNSGTIQHVLFGNTGNDSLTNAGSVRDVAGGDGDDTLANSGEADYLLGEDGADLIVNGGTVVVDINAGVGSDTVALLDDAVVGRLIDGGEDADGTDIDRLEFRFTVNQQEYDDFASQFAAASPAGGSISFRGQTFNWINFEELVNLLRIAAEEARRSGLATDAIVTVTLNDNRLNTAWAAPVAIYWNNGSLNVYAIDANGSGVLAVAAAPETLAIGESVAGMGSTLTRIDAGTIRVTANGGAYTFDVAAPLSGS